MPLDEDVTRLAKGKNLATAVTLMPNGQPQALLTWVDADDEYVMVNTEPQRQRARNVARDPRITVLIRSEDDPYDWAEVRGHVAVMDEHRLASRAPGLAHAFWHLEGVADRPPDGLGVYPVREGALDRAPAELVEHEVLGHALRIHVAELRTHPVPEFGQPHVAQGTAGPGPDLRGG